MALENNSDKGKNMTEEFQIEEGVLVAYTGRSEAVTVPEQVRAIGPGAFKACVSLKKVILPDTLRTIGENAFKGCRKLEEVRIPGQVSEIGSYAFHRCHGLKQMILPPSVKELGDCTFLYCDSLTEIRMPGVRRLGRQAFVNDVLLEKIEISEDLQEACICDVFTGCGKICEIAFSGGACFRIPNAVEAVAGDLPLPALVRLIAVDILRMMELEGRTLVRFLTNLKHVDVPEGIEVLAKSCFFDKRGILSVKLPKTLKEIGSRAFRNCIGLETVIFEGGSVRIHEDAFKNCTSLKTIRICDEKEYRFEGLAGLRGTEIPEMVRRIYRQVMGNFRISGTILLKYLGSESRVAVPEGITQIAEEAFAGNEAIDRVILPDSVYRIGAEAFRDCLLLQTIVLPGGLEKIGPGAFENCVKLIRIRLPQEVRHIEERTFRHCTVLREVRFPEGFYGIEESAFYGCTSLREISFPDSLRWIGRMAFYRCSGLKEVRLPAGVGCVESLAFGRSGVRRVQIGADGGQYKTEVFGGCRSLQTLVLKEGVRHIPDKLAYGCTALAHVSVPESVQSVGRFPWEKTPFLAEWKKRMDTRDGVFWDGRDLEGKVRLSDQVRILAGGAFYGNENLTEVYLPDSVRWIGPGAFKGCRCLLRVRMPFGMERMEAEVFSGCTELQEIWFSETEEPQPVPAWKFIGERAFYRCGKLRGIRLDRVERIEKEAFAGCGTLERSIPAHKKDIRIGERAFEGTGYLEGREGTPVAFGRVLLSGGDCSGEVCLQEEVAGIVPYAFAGNRRITKVRLPESLQWIGEGAFYGCSGLLEVEFPEGIMRIERSAFEKCIRLQKIETAARQAGTAAFAGCVSLKEAAVPNLSILTERLFENCRELKTCHLERAGAILSHCFSGCRALKQVLINMVHVVRPYAFAGCDGLTAVEFRDEACLCPHAMEDCGSLEKITLTGENGTIRLYEYALSGCTALRRIVRQGKTWEFHDYGDICSERLPETARLMFHSAFSCFLVEQEERLCGYRGSGRIVKIPEGIRRIEAEVFRDVLMLEDVEIPKSVEYIGAKAFHGTEWLKKRREEDPLVIVNHMLLDGSGCAGEVAVPEDVRLVCGWAFAGGLQIRKLRFLSDRVRVEEYAFRNCINLQEMVLADGSCVHFTGLADRERELPALARQAAFDSLNCFKTDPDGVLVECTGNLAQLKLARGITAVGDGAFEDSNLLTELCFPETVKKIGKRAFAGCRWLREVRSADHVEQIGAQAFSGCGVLERVELSDAFGSMGSRAFENCTSLEEILLPEGVEEIPERAFYRCHSLKRVTVPSTLKRIGREAFAFCRELRELQVPEGTMVEERAFEGCSDAVVISGNMADGLESGAGVSGRSGGNL